MGVCFYSCFGYCVWSNFKTEFCDRSVCPKSYLKAVASGGGGNVDNTNVANKDLILKCFVNSTNTSKANSVETTVLIITKILLIHLGNRG